MDFPSPPCEVAQLCGLARDQYGPGRIQVPDTSSIEFCDGPRIIWLITLQVNHLCKVGIASDEGMGYFFQMKSKPHFALARLMCAALLLIGLGAAPSFAGEDGYYKWMDDKGRPHHSDRPPPPGVAYEFVPADGSMRRRVTAEESAANPIPTTAQEQQNSEPVSEEEGAVVKNSVYCDQAKNNLETLDSKARVRIRDADGNIRFMTEEEKEAQRQKARDLISVHCG